MKRPRNRRRLRVRPTASLGTRQNQPPATARRLPSRSPTLRLLHLLTALVDDGGAGGEGGPGPGPRRAIHGRQAAPRRLRPGPQGRAPDLLPARSSRPQLPPLPQGAHTSSFPACAKIVSLHHGIDAPHWVNNTVRPCLDVVGFTSIHMCWGWGGLEWNLN